MKANPVRQVLVQRREVYSDAGNLRTWGTPVSKPILTSHCSHRRGKAEQREQRGQRERAEKFSMCRWVQSILIRQVMGCCASSKFSPSLFYVILVLQLISKSSRAWVIDQSLYPLTLVPRILIQTCCPSISHILVSVSIYRNNVKIMVGRITIPPVAVIHCDFQTWVCLIIAWESC